MEWFILIFHNFFCNLLLKSRSSIYIILISLYKCIKHEHIYIFPHICLIQNNLKKSKSMKSSFPNLIISSSSASYLDFETSICKRCLLICFVYEFLRKFLTIFKENFRNIFEFNTKISIILIINIYI